MKTYFSPSRKGLFNLPVGDDAVLLTEEVAAALMIELAAGKVLDADAEGNPITVEAPHIPTPEEEYLAKPLAELALKFSPAGQFSLMVLGLCALSSLAGKSQVKAFLMTTLGLILSTVGVDPISGVARMTSAMASSTASARIPSRRSGASRRWTRSVISVRRVVMVTRLASPTTETMRSTITAPASSMNKWKSGWPNSCKPAARSSTIANATNAAGCHWMETTPIRAGAHRE